MREIKIDRRFKFESYIGRNQNWWNYYQHYREATAVMIEEINSNVPVDTVALPVLFMIRHSIELGLKANILEFEKFSSAKPKLKLNGKSHNLVLLYDYFESHLQEVCDKYNVDKTILARIDEFKEHMLKFVDKLDSIDKGSFNFRYPVNLEGNPNFEFADRINLADYTELLQVIDPFIMITSGILAEHGMMRMEDYY
jgi:hypothetical protein